MLFRSAQHLVQLGAGGGVLQEDLFLGEDEGHGAEGGQQQGKQPAATGKLEKVGEHETEIFTWSGKIGSGKFWVAKDFEHFAELNAIQDKLMKAMGNPAAAMVPPNSDFPGMVVKSEMSVMGKTATSELVSAKQDPIDSAVFTAPEGYQEMKMPSLPGQ